MPLAKKHVRYAGRVVILGFGSIGQGTLPLILRHVDMDAKRMRSLGYVQELTDSERGNARARIRENQLVIELVEYALDERAWSYRYAAERLVLAVPSPLAVQAEQSIGRFQALLTGIDDYLVQCRGAASLLPDDEAVPVRPLVTK